MRSTTIGLWALLLACLATNASAQSFSARRMAMGGVLLGGGPGGAASNVAYRAVPAASDGRTSIPLPLGLIPLLSNPPSFDPSDSTFNAYELANLLYNPPWNLTLGSSKTPSSDITIEIAQNRLAVDLGEIADVFPKDHTRIGSTIGEPAIGFGVRQFFVAVAPLIEYDNDLSLNDALRGALRDGEPFLPNTQYQVFDDGRAQAAADLQLGMAMPLMQNGEPRAPGSSALYAGARVKILRGLAYGQAENVASFTTRDTLFGSNPVDIGYNGHYRDAGPDGGGWGRGLDLGAVWLLGNLELGLGANDVATRIDWKVRESVAYTDSATGNYVQNVLRTDAPFTSEVPTTYVANAALRLGNVLLAGDVVRGINNTQGHAGAEIWIHNLALRAGGSIDENQMLQFGGGTGIRFGHFGLDVALATNSRNMTRERTLELGAGLALYH